MENKYSPKTQAEIEKILSKIHTFKKLYSKINLDTTDMMRYISEKYFNKVLKKN